MPYVSIDGIQTYYERAGEPGRRALIMVHGASQDTLSWRYAIPFFAQHYDVIAVDLPGHGKSSLHGSRGVLDSTAHNARHVIEIGKTLGLSHPIIMGHSMGGGVATSAASQAPDFVGGLVLVDGTAYNAAQTTGYHSSVVKDLARVNPNDWFSVNFGTLLGKRTNPARGAEIVAEARRCIPEVAFGDLENFAAYRLVDDLPNIVCPVVVVECDEDWSVPPEPARQAIALMKAPTDFLLFEGVGHFPQTEQPEEFCSRTLEAMRRLGLN